MEVAAQGAVSPLSRGAPCLGCSLSQGLPVPGGLAVSGGLPVSGVLSQGVPCCRGLQRWPQGGVLRCGLDPQLPSQLPTGDTWTGLA